MLNSIKKIFTQKTDYKKLKKEISPVPSRFIKDLIDSINLGLIDKTDNLLSDLSSGEIANVAQGRGAQEKFARIEGTLIEKS